MGLWVGLEHGLVKWTSVAVSVSSSLRRRHLYVNISFLFESTPSTHTNIPFLPPTPLLKHPRILEKQTTQSNAWMQVFLQRPHRPSEMHHPSDIFRSHTSRDNFHASKYPDDIDLCLGSWDIRENLFTVVKTGLCVSKCPDYGSV